MRMLYYECFSGISGDMNLGAMVDLGVPEEYLIDELKKLGVDGYTITVERGKKMAIEGTKLTVHLDSEKKDNSHDHHHNHHDEHHGHTHDHEHGHSHGNHDHDHSHGHTHGDHHHHHHEDQRNYYDIVKIIDKSDLNDTVKNISKNIFHRIAVAEAKVHGTTVEEIHFHEVGAVDSIVDIIGAAICYDYLKVDVVKASTVEVGSGFVMCQHGKMPVPAPATAELLQGIPMKKGGVPFESTTPTGAAILAELVSEFTDTVTLTPDKVGIGVGGKDGPIPNIVRVYLTEEHSDKSREEGWILECNIDDMNPEIYSYVIDTLLDNGASDAFMIPIIMKKGRPAIMVKVLCKASKVGELENILFNETTTLGVRSYPVSKAVLTRETFTINTKYGTIRMKKSFVGDKVNTVKAEYDDCCKAARQYNIPLKEVYQEINRHVLNNENP